MKNYFKRVVAIFLAVLFLSGMMPSNENGWFKLPDFSFKSEAASGLVYGTNNKITRAEWLYDLAYIFDMTVDENSLPDNYFSDLTEEHKYYGDILKTVQFGVVDIAAGEALYPDNAVTREFAASTLNFCLGYQLEEGSSYTFSDSASVLDPDSAQIAINKKWLSLSGGKFCPDLNVTEQEVKTMLSDAESVLNANVVDESYDNTYNFESDVTVIPDGTLATEDENGVVTITDCPKTISVGSKFAVYFNGIPVVYTAQNVRKTGADTVIETVAAESSDAFSEIDAQGSVGSEELIIEAADGVELEVEEEEATTYGLARISDSIKIKNIKANKKVNINGAQISIEVKIKNPRVDYIVNFDKVYVALVGKTEVTVKAGLDLAEASGWQSVDLVNCTYPGIGGFTISTVFELGGAVSSTIEGQLTTGIEWTKKNNFRLVKNFNQCESYTSAEVSAKLGLSAKLGITKLPVLNAYVYADVGFEAKLSHTTHSTGTPKKCTHFAAYLYAECGAKASVELGIYESECDLNYVIFDDENSPVRIVHHYEDGITVGGCTRGLDYSNYFTRYNSRWGGSGWSGANGAYGLGADGKPFALYNYTVNSDGTATITKYNGNSSYVSIPKTIDGHTVTIIGSKAFQFKFMREVVIPDTVTEIKNGAFLECDLLSSVTLSKSLKKMDAYAFGYCDSLESIEIPKSLEETYTAYYYDYYYGYCYGVFRGCSSLKNVSFENGTTKIVKGLFTACTGLRSVNIPDTVTVIENDAFTDCVNLKNVKLSENLVTIGSKAFRNTAITKIDIPNTVTTIADGVFADCEYLSDVKLSKSLTTISAYAFAKCESLTNIEIPKSLQSTKDAYYGEYIYNYHYGVFFGCDNLKEVTFEQGATLIPCGLFANNDGIEEIIIPDTVTKIEHSAFLNCTNLKTVKLSESLITIGSKSFRNTAITQIDIPDTVTSILDGAFADCKYLSKVNLSKALSTISAYAFAKCEALTSIEIPKSLKTTKEAYYGEYKYGYHYGVFFGCNNLKTVTFENGVTIIPTGLFANNEGLEKIEIPDTVTKIDHKAFLNCVNLKEVILHDNLTEIVADAFNNTGIKTIELPDTVTTLGNAVFANCKYLESVTLSNKVKTVPSSAFENCISLSEVVLENITKIVQYAFKNCTALENIVIPESVKTIENNVFEKCTALKKVNIPQSTKSLGSNVFLGCEALANVDIADYSITTINSSTFKDCPTTAKIVLPKGLKTISGQAFANNTSLTEVTIPQSVTSIDSTAFSYPTKTTIYGVKGSYAETFATNGGFKFVDIAKACTGIALKDFAVDVYLETGEDYRPEFVELPEDHTDIITLTASNNKVSIDGLDIHANNSGDTVITATTTNGMEYQFTVHIKAVKEIAVTTNPTKLDYLLGEKFEPKGLAVKVVYDDGSSKLITDYTLSGFNSSVEGTNTITVSWNALTGRNYTTKFTLNIIDPNPKLQSIYIDTLPFRTLYNRGVQLDTSGMSVKGNYSDGAVKEITDYTLSSINVLKLGEQTITVTSGEKTAEFTVTVVNCTSHVSGDWENSPDGKLTKRCITCQEALESKDKPGDIDGDATIGATDTVMFRKALMGAISVDKNNLGAYDVNEDGSLDVRDLVRIKRIIANPPEEKPVLNGWISENGGWYYYENGVKLTNTWMQDSVGWCYLGSDGRMATNAWVPDSVGMCYVGENGYCKTDTWLHDGNGWCYLDSNGRKVTNQWIKDSEGWCYLGADGYCITNSWMKDSVGWCYLDENGRMLVSEWLYDGGKWYYLNSSGYMVTGTQTIDGVTYTFGSDGALIE